MPEYILLRPATLNDVSQLAEIHAASWRFAYRSALSDKYLLGDIVAERRESWVKRLGEPKPNQYVVVAENSGEISGFACTYAKEHSEWGSLLDCIHVRQSHHGKGVGSLLMRDVASWCSAAAPDTPFYLWVLKSNLQAQSFYQRFGAINAGEDAWVTPEGRGAPCYRYSWKCPENIVCRDRN